LQLNYFLLVTDHNQTKMCPIIQKNSYKTKTEKEISGETDGFLFCLNLGAIVQTA